MHSKKILIHRFNLPNSSDHLSGAEPEINAELVGTVELNINIHVLECSLQGATGARDGNFTGLSRNGDCAKERKVKYV
jgi:hypothetical protein